jgi:sec-independent protein translocase protein TatA
MPNIGMGELLVILVIVMLVFGASRLPQIGEGFGKAIRGFKRGIQGDDDIKVSDRSKQVGADSSAQLGAGREHQDMSRASHEGAADAEVVERKS